MSFGFRVKTLRVYGFRVFDAGVQLTAIVWAARVLINVTWSLLRLRLQPYRKSARVKLSVDVESMTVNAIANSPETSLNIEPELYN